MKRDVSRHEVRIPRWAFVMLCLLLAGIALAFWSKLRHNRVHLRADTRGRVVDLLPSIAGLSRGELTAGNRVTVLQNGAYFPAVLQEIANAKQSIHFESYVWWKGDICRQIASALAAKARQGVVVRVLLDASGSSKMDDDLLKLMKDAGCHVAKFHPPRISNFGRMNNRDHRKIVVVDGRVGFTGGHGIASEWTGNAQDKKHWRDTFIRIEGPIVSQLQAAFCENWIEETGEAPIGPRYFPPLTPAGTTVAHLSYSSPSGTVSSVQLLYYLAITSAKSELLIQNPYFLPDKDAIVALEQAVKRGVKVRVMIPSADVNDSPIVQHASHHHYGTLLKRGVQVYEYRKTLLHQKILIVDGVWSVVGSTNFDDRSFDINDEVSIGLYDPNVAQQLRAAFFADLASCQPITLAEWKNRGFLHKMEDGLAYSINDEL